MKTLIQKSILFPVILSAACGLGLALLVQISDFNTARAWVEPSQAPPGGNIAAPINTGSQSQLKQGFLDLGINGSSQCCASQQPNLSLDQASAATGQMSWLQFHNAGESEAYIRLSGGGSGSRSGQRRLEVGDSQGVRTSLTVTGNLGVGTTNPTQKLEVAGNSFLSSDNNGTVTIGGQNNTGEGAEIVMLSTGNTAKAVGNTFHFDNLQGYARLFWGDNTDDHTLQIFNYKNGVANLWVEGSIYTDQDLVMGASRTLYSPGRMHIFGEENLYLLNRGGAIVSKAWGGNGNLTVEGTASTPTLCLSGDCRSSWPAGENSWWEANYASVECPTNNIVFTAASYDLAAYSPDGLKAFLNDSCRCYTWEGYFYNGVTDIDKHTVRLFSGRGNNYYYTLVLGIKPNPCAKFCLFTLNCPQD